MCIQQEKITCISTRDLIEYLKQYSPDTPINLVQLNTLSYLTKVTKCVNMDTNKMELVF